LAYYKKPEGVNDMVETTGIARLLGGRRVLGRAAGSMEGLVASVRSGLPAGALDSLRERLGLSAAEASTAFGIPARTLSRRRSASAYLTPSESDRVARVARIFALATSVLGDDERARGWLRGPNRALRGSRPLDLLDTELGTHEVEAVLGRIAHGVYS
jgi:putative toxin-antitoxin system antitoxin component (TIGR02293 family)